MIEELNGIAGTDVISSRVKIECNECSLVFIVVLLVFVFIFLGCGIYARCDINRIKKVFTPMTIAISFVLVSTCVYVFCTQVFYDSDVTYYTIKVGKNCNLKDILNNYTIISSMGDTVTIRSK